MPNQLHMVERSFSGDGVIRLRGEAVNPDRWANGKRLIDQRFISAIPVANAPLECDCGRLWVGEIADHACEKPAAIILEVDPTRKADEMIQRYIILGEVPGETWDAGQVVGIDRGADKLLASKLIKQLPHGMPLCACDCGAAFLTLEALAAHQSKRHPKPAPKAKPEPAPKAETVPEAPTGPEPMVETTLPPDIPLAPLEPLPKEEDHEENP